MEMGRQMALALTVLPAADEAPLGEMPLAPAGLSGRSQSELAQAMAALLQASQPASGADALKALRSAFPASALGARVAALAALVRR